MGMVEGWEVETAAGAEEWEVQLTLRALHLVVQEAFSREEGEAHSGVLEEGWLCGPARTPLLGLEMVIDSDRQSQTG